MDGAFAFALTAALNPTLLTATMVMLFAAEPRRLMGGYLLGAYLSSIGIGLVIVFALEGSGAASTTQNTLSPAADVVLGLLFILVAYVVHGSRDAALRERRRVHAQAKGPKKPPKWREALDNGTAKSAFVVGILLTLPGASFIAGMDRIAKADTSTAVAVAAVVAFCVIMLALIEIPLLGFALKPEWTRCTVKRFTDWVSRDARVIVTRFALGVGLLLIARAAVTVVSS
jgi:Sap, sulfolipid-1-addressing protein